MSRFIVPTSLKKGDSIGIIAPSGVIQRKEDFFKGIQILQNMGFEPKFPRELWPGCSYLADSDENRKEEFCRIWNDPEIKAVMAARGGFGCLRLAESIDFGRLSTIPKIFLGFSDITLLHSRFNDTLGLVTFHGPVVTSLSQLTRESLHSLHSLLSTDIRGKKYFGKIDILRRGAISNGVTTGGNLSTIVSTLGTVFEPSWDKKIVFLEDNNEPVYRLDRMLTQLKLAGKFEKASALILGDFSHGLSLDRIGVMRHHEAIWNRILELTSDKTAVWANFPIGHGCLNTAIPLGIQASLDNTTGEINFG